jgi:Tfp pilus assembly protein PilW
MAKLTRKKVSAGTLIEVIIAMVIIMIVFGIALKIFSNVLFGGVSYQQVSVQNQLDILATEVKDKGFVANELVVLDSINYHFLTDTSAILGISKLEIKAVRNDKQLGKINCLYQVKENETTD